MAGASGAGRTHRIATRRSLSAALALSALSLACQDANAPTEIRNLEGGAARHAAAAPSEVIPGQYIVTFNDSVQDVPGLARRIAAQYGSEPMYTYTTVIKGFTAQLADQAVEALQHNPQIERIEPDRLRSVEPDEAEPTQSPLSINSFQTESTLGAESSPPSWGIDRVDQRNLPLDKSYSWVPDGTGVNVYVFDTGIHQTHAEFGGRAFGAYTAILDGYGTDDCNGHGTHVAGTIGGNTVGIAKKATLWSVRVMDCTGSGGDGGIVSGIDWVTQNGPRPAVVNMSFGGGVSSTLTLAIQNSIKTGVVYAVSAGNGAVDACTQGPANVPEALTVAASASNDYEASYSNYGSCVDVFAPGNSIYSALNTSDVAYGTKSGTSMASPHVAGAAALYLSAHPSATSAEVANAIVTSATPNVLSGVTSGTANLLLYTRFDLTTQTDTTTSPTPTPTPVDQPPTASFTASCPKGGCTFDASGSTDDYGITSYSWSFGDGTSTTSALATRVSHKYAATGFYVVTLTVTDGAGQVAKASKTVKVNKL